MTRREMVLTVVGIFVVSLVARAYFAAQIVFPKPEDTAYYVGVARNMLEGRGLVSDALWSYQTPPLVFPRPAFEVWLPLPTFLAAIPMAIFGLTFPAAQVSSVIVGALVPVLTWRLALDVAEERGLDLERTRWIGIGAGLTTAVYLPLLLSSALPDSTMPFAVIVLGACLLMTRLVRDPRGAALTDPRLIVLGVLLGLGAMTRNETVWLAIIWAAMAWFLVHRPASERIRLIGVVAVVAAVVFAPWALRNLAVLGSPLAGPGRHERAVPLRLRHLRLERPADPRPSPGDRAGGPRRPAHRRPGPQPLQRARAARYPRVGHRALRAAVAGPRAVAAAAALDQPDHVLRHEPAVPGGNPMGNLPARRGARARADRHLGDPCTRCRPRSAWSPDGVDEPDRLDRHGRGAWILAAVLRWPCYRQFGGGSQDTRDLYAELGARMAAIDRPLDATAGPVITNFPIWMAEVQRIPSLALPDEPPEDVLDLARHFPGTRLMVLIAPEGKHWPGDLERGLPGAECFQPVDLGAPIGGAAGEDLLEDVLVYEVVCP